MKKVAQSKFLCGGEGVSLGFFEARGVDTEGCTMSCQNNIKLSINEIYIVP